MNDMQASCIFMLTMRWLKQERRLVRNLMCHEMLKLYFRDKLVPSKLNKLSVS